MGRIRLIGLICLTIGLTRPTWTCLNFKINSQHNYEKEFVIKIFFINRFAHPLPLPPFSECRLQPAGRKNLFAGPLQ